MSSTAGTPADPPYRLAAPSKPKLKLPAGSALQAPLVDNPQRLYKFAPARQLTVGAKT